MKHLTSVQLLSLPEEDRRNYIKATAIIDYYNKILTRPSSTWPRQTLNENLKKES